MAAQGHSALARGLETRFRGRRVVTETEEEGFDEERSRKSVMNGKVIGAVEVNLW